MPEPIMVMYYIEVDSGGNNAKVSQIPPVGRMNVGKHTMSFASNNPRAAIRFTGDSPFMELDAGVVLEVGNRQAKGPWVAAKQGNFHFDCGAKDSQNRFVLWGGGGGEPPVDA